MEEQQYLNDRLIDAAENGYFDKVKESINDGADINCVDKNGWSVLDNACWFKHNDIVYFLLDNGCEVNSKGHNTDTALILSCYIKNAHAVKMLLNHGADVGICNDFGKTCFIYNKTIWTDDELQELVITKQPHNIKLLDDEIGILPELMEKYKDIMELSLMGLF